MPAPNPNPAPGTEDAGAEEKDTTQQEQTDAFGEPINPPASEKKEGDDKGGDGDGDGDGGEKKKEDEKKHPEIAEDHPVVLALKKQIEGVKNEYGGNLSKQRDIIKTLTDKIEELTKGKEKTDEPDVLFKDDEIKWSKDLTKEQREEMTDTEIRQMDEIAANRVAMNKMYTEQRKGEAARKEETETKEKSEVENLNKLVQDTAKELSKGEDGKENTDLANQIIEQVKIFNLEGIDEATVKERVKAAATMLPDYKPPKEQKKKAGKAIDGTKGGDDPFGVDSIVEEASKGNDGSYDL